MTENRRNDKKRHGVADEDVGAVMVAVIVAEESSELHVAAPDCHGKMLTLKLPIHKSLIFQQLLNFLKRKGMKNTYINWHVLKALEKKYPVNIRLQLKYWGCSLKSKLLVCNI